LTVTFVLFKTLPQQLVYSWGGLLYNRSV